jgi:hypothetical protein
MAVMLNFLLAFGLITVTNELFELGLWNVVHRAETCLWIGYEIVWESTVKIMVLMFNFWDI